MSPLSFHFATVSIAFVLTAASAHAAPAPFTLLHRLFDPGTNAQEGTLQGTSVAADGNLAVIGAPQAYAGAERAGVVKVYNAATGALLHTLYNPSPAPSEYFGMTVAVSGMRIVVGASFHSSSAMWEGAAYVYDLAGATPTVPVLTLTNPSPAFDSRFGSSVAISGSRVVVGASTDDTGAMDTGIAYVFDLGTGTPAVPFLTLTNPSPAPSEGFGGTVAISGTRVVVGAPAESSAIGLAGAAYVYDLAGATPGLPALILTNPIPEYFGLFGFSVAISGTRVAVGASLVDVLELGAMDAGRAYVFDLANANPTMPMVTLNNPSPLPNDNFGSSIALSGNRVVVGGNRAGRAYVYDLAGATPSLPTFTLNNPTPGFGDWYGFAVALSGNRAVIGDYGDSTLAHEAGSTYVYELSGPMPTVPSFTLNHPLPAAGDHFGAAVATSGARLIVGAPGTKDAGVAYIHELASTNPAAPRWVLTNALPDLGGNFGQVVAISGVRAAVGANWIDFGSNVALVASVYELAGPSPTQPALMLTNPNPSGALGPGYSLAIAGTRVVAGTLQGQSALVFDLSSATPSLPVLTLTNPSPTSGSRFGHAVAISGSRIVVGAFLDETSALNGGSAFVYDLGGAIPAQPILTLTNPNPVSHDSFGYSVAIDGTRVVIGAHQHSAGASNAGAAYVFDLGRATPTVPSVTLTNPSPAEREFFGWSVGISSGRVAVGTYADAGSSANSGSIYVYDVDGASPTVPVATLLASAASSPELLTAVAIDGTTIIGGTPYDDTNVPDRGAVHVFGLRPTLNIAPAGPGFATVSWTPTNAPGFVLKYREALSATNWLNAPTGASNPAQVPVTNAIRFYRVGQP